MSRRRSALAAILLVSVLGIVLVGGAGCEPAPREPGRKEKVYYAVAIEMQTACEQLVEACLRNWARDHNKTGREGCPLYLLGEGEPQELRSQALLTVLEDLERQRNPEMNLDQDLDRHLVDLYQAGSKTCKLLDRGVLAYTDLQREFSRSRNRFRTAQREVLERMPVTSLEANKLFDRWENKVEMVEGEIRDRKREARAASREAENAEWRRFVDHQRRARRPTGDRTTYQARSLRNVSSAESAAAQLAIEYLVDGPEAWADRLAQGSWLERLGERNTLEEIEVRAGRWRSSVWELQAVVGDGDRDTAIFTIESPSGLDEILEMELVGDGSSWRIESVRSWIDARPGRTSGPESERQSLEELGALLHLRRTLARKPDPETVQEIIDGLPDRSHLAEVAELWQIQILLRGGNLNAAETLLRGHPLPAARLLTEILRGRLAFLRGEGIDAAAAYERAIDGESRSDGLLLEVAGAMELMGFPRRSEELLREVAASGSGNAEVYYRLARSAALDRDEELAARLFETGWTMRPLERRDVLGDRILSYIVRESDLLGLLEVERAQEPTPRPPDVGRTPIEVPRGMESRFHGRYLRLEVGDSSLSIPGGVRLAPADVRPEDPRARRLAEEQRLLAELESLKRAAAGAGALIQPALRTEITDAARALARHNRWHDLVELTRGPAVRAEQLPTELASLRAEALRRLDRTGEARRLLFRVAKSRADQKRKDPQPLYELGLLLAARGEYDEAERVVRMAEKQSPEEPISSLVPRIRLEERLNRSFLTRRSEHFEIRYPLDTADYFVERLADALEQELERLRTWIPWKPPEPLEVQLYDADDFFRAFAPGRDVLGLFDGKIRVPLANVPSLHPRILGILTHELAHALLAGATSDQSPHWFHEGLAQHVQPVQQQVNPIPDYRRLGTFLSFPLIEPVLSSPSDPFLTMLGYEEAVWVVHYLEARHGEREIRRLVDAFAQGQTTEEALAGVLGASVLEFDEEVWRWCLEDAPAAWPVEMVRYDLGPPEGIRFPGDGER